MSIAKVRKVLPVLGLLGCVSDFSPDPYKGNQNVDQTPWPDGGGKDAGKSDAKAPTKDGDAVGPTDDSASADDDPPEPTIDGGDPSGCNLSGRWILTERATSTAIGAVQVSRLWNYVGLEQEGDAITMKKTLLCGGSTASPPTELVVVQVDDMAAWPGYVKNPSYNGRTGTAKAGAEGCDVAIAEGVAIRGMTVAYYQDRSHALPTKDQQANGATPGWEDWDNDGKPGITQAVGDLGTLYTAVRTFSTYEGKVPEGASKFELDYDWEQQRVVLGSKDPDYGGLLSSPAQRDNTPGKNFVQFARLSATQATGSDEGICEAIRALADTLTPEANAEP